MAKDEAAEATREVEDQLERERDPFALDAYSQSALPLIPLKGKRPRDSGRTKENYSPVVVTLRCFGITG